MDKFHRCLVAAPVSHRFKKACCGHSSKPVRGVWDASNYIDMSLVFPCNVVVWPLAFWLAFLRRVAAGVGSVHILGCLTAAAAVHALLEKHWESEILAPLQATHMARPGMLGLSAVRLHDGAARSLETLRSSRPAASKPQGMDMLVTSK